MHRMIARIGRSLFGISMALSLIIGSSAPCARAAAVSFPILHAGEKSYTNAVVTLPTSGKIGKALVISHSSGMASIKVADLDDDARVRLGLLPLQQKSGSASAAQPSASARSANSSGSASISNPGLRKIVDLLRAGVERVEEGFHLSWIEWLILSGIFGIYLMGCKACKDLCRRAGSPSSILVWLPICKRLALFKAV